MEQDPCKGNAPFGGTYCFLNHESWKRSLSSHQTMEAIQRLYEFLFMSKKTHGDSFRTSSVNRTCPTMHMNSNINFSHSMGDVHHIISSCLGYVDPQTNFTDMSKKQSCFSRFFWWRAKTFPEKSETRKHQMQGKLLSLPSDRKSHIAKYQVLRCPHWAAWRVDMPSRCTQTDSWDPTHHNGKCCNLKQRQEALKK